MGMPRSVLITAESAEPLRGMLEAGGVRTVHVPLIALRPTAAPPPQGTPEVVVITSAAVPRFLPGLSARIGTAQVVAVGEATGAALVSVGVQPERVGHAGGASVIAGLSDTQGMLWYIGAAEPSAGVLATLEDHIGPVARWSVYENRLPVAAAEELMRAGPVDLVTLTSASAAVRYSALAGGSAAPVAVLGQPTAEAALSAGLTIAVQSARPRLSALAEAVLGA